MPQVHQAGGLTMSSLQGELNKQMSLPSFKNAGQRTINVQSHDFMPGALASLRENTQTEMGHKQPASQFIDESIQQQTVDHQSKLE